MGGLFSRDDNSFLLRKSERRKSHMYQAEKMRSWESLDYRVADDLPLREFYRKANLAWKGAQRLVAKWFIYLLIGIVIGLIAFSIKECIDVLQDFKESSVITTIEHTNRAAGFFTYLAICWMYAILATLPVLFLHPLVGGSGIPEVKGYLNGVKVNGMINIKTFIGKIFSIIFAFSSSLALGPEGPMVHIGSMVGGGLGSAKSRTLHIRLPKMFERLRTDLEQRDFISSGASAGIAAAFGAPIGGVLFAIEETSSFWSRELTWRTFFACMIAAFTVNVMFHFTDTSNGLSDNSGLLAFGISRDFTYSALELIPFALLGVLGGLLGALFVKLNIRINSWRRAHLPPSKKFLRFVEVMAVAGGAALLYYTIPLMFNSCKPSPIYDDGLTNTTTTDVCDKVVKLKITELFCEAGNYNPVANLFILPQDKALRLLFSRTTEFFTPGALAAFLPVYFLCVTVVAGISVAAGLFVPMMLIGATYGRMVGQLMVYAVGESSEGHKIDPSIYALVGAAAMMSGFSRTTISLCIIMMELTESTQFLLPIMLAVMCAKWVGDACSKSIYEELMELKSITFLEHHPPSSTYLMNVSDVMQSSVVCINEVESVAKIVEILRTTTHNGFPVVKRLGDNRSLTYRGMILRKQLLILLHMQKYQDQHAIGSPPVFDYESYIALMNKQWSIRNIKLPTQEEQERLLLDVTAYTDKSHLVVLNTSSFMDAYRLFQNLGLRHLPVVDEQLQVVGILTRHDLLHFYDSAYTENMQLGFLEE